MAGGAETLNGFAVITAREHMAIKIIKKTENFSEQKLRASLKRVGAIPKATKEAVAAVRKKLRNGMSTLDIRKIVTAVLKKHDKRAHKKYLSFHKKK
jgi:transcriptional regulator NrdR family protein